jgi:hypothetical protein
LEGTIYSAAEEIRRLGGDCLPCQCDIRFEEQIQRAVEEGVKKFGGIDIVVNNASAINLTGTLQTETKRFDLMHQINTRSIFLSFPQLFLQCILFLILSMYWMLDLKRDIFDFEIVLALFVQVIESSHFEHLSTAEVCSFSLFTNITNHTILFISKNKLFRPFSSNTTNKIILSFA